MHYTLHINSRTRKPTTLALDAPYPVSDAELTAWILDGENTRTIGTLKRDEYDRDYDFAFTYRMPAHFCEADNAAEEAVTLFFDQMHHSENWHRFDHFREQWTRILLLTPEDWKYIILRTCEDDYDTWTQLFYGDRKACGDRIAAPKMKEIPVLEAEPEKVLRKLSFINSMDALVQAVTK